MFGQQLARTEGRSLCSSTGSSHPALVMRSPTGLSCSNDILFGRPCGILQSLYYKYAGKEGDKKTLTKQQLKELVLTEIPFCKKPRTAEVEALIEDLDRDKNSEVSFQEYFTFLGKLSMLSYYPPRKDQ
ncbi:PREDICTED: protein S100-A6-like [Chinchilla lanigera]|uniref:protein S100-A6-like n=1 Tax=Chinchilla lanigera TaxID=34839 RepID=UPI00038E99F1|nr:PREDICTED: protein S100-A6-like [Chinchilla lanigera]